MRREPQYLWDILEAAEAIERFIAVHTEESFVANDLVRSAVLSKLMIIGEASMGISDATKEKYASIPWAQIRGMRNYVIHQYHGVNWEVVWNAATRDAPSLAKQIEQILSTEYPGYEAEFD